MGAYLNNDVASLLQLHSVYYSNPLCTGLPLASLAWDIREYELTVEGNEATTASVTT